MPHTQTANNAAAAPPLVSQDGLEGVGNTPKTIETRFGPMEFAAENAIRLPQGLIGFSRFHEFGLVDLPDTGLGALKLLQCLNETSLSFIVAPLKDGQSAIDQGDLDEALKAMGTNDEDALILLVVSIRKEQDGVDVSVNLRAPLILNKRTRTARQFVLSNSRYPVRQSL